MTAHVLVTGTLFRAPERKTSRNGRDYAAATLKVREGENGSTFWRLTCFSESAMSELLRLTDGDGVSCQGSMKAEIYKPDNGEPRLSLSLVADQVLALRQPARRRENAAGEPNEPRRYDRAPDRYQRPSDRAPRAGISVCRSREFRERVALDGPRAKRGDELRTKVGSRAQP
ncbi:MAG TPA: single-stranded DNA-binding protein [Methylocystis sp.]|jgi:single-stranded DNA-binding protein